MKLIVWFKKWLILKNTIENVAREYKENDEIKKVIISLQEIDLINQEAQQ